MSKENEESMEISSTTDLEALQSPKHTQSENVEEQMEVQEITEGEGSQEEGITSTNTATEQSTEITESVEVDSTKNDEKSTDNNVSSTEKGIGEGGSNDANEDVDMESTNEDANIGSSENKEIDEVCVEADSSEKFDDKDKTSDVNEESGNDNKKTYLDSEKTGDDNEKTGDKDTSDEEKTGDNDDEKTGDNDDEKIRNNDDEKTGNDDGKTSDDNEKTGDKDTSDNEKTADNVEKTADDAKKIDEEQEKTSERDEKTDASDNEKSDKSNKATEDSKTSDDVEKISSIPMDIDNTTEADVPVEVGDENNKCSDETSDKNGAVNDKDASSDKNCAVNDKDASSDKNVTVSDKNASTETSMEIDEGTKTAVNNESTINDEHSIFVQETAENNDKPSTPSEQNSTDVDPIGSTEWSQNSESFVSELDEADECIIPDTNREEMITGKEPPLSQSSSTTSTQSNDSMKLSEKYLVSVASGDAQSACMICDEKKLCKYNCSKNDVQTKICSEDCLSKLKAQHPENVIVRQLRVKSFSLDKSLQGSDGSLTSITGISGDAHSRFITCKACGSSISNANHSLSWEALDFCNEQCLTKHQKLFGSLCTNCKIDVKDNFLGKYCVRFGYNVRQFCSCTCLEEYKKGSKVCSFCQDDISCNRSGFLTSIGDKGLSKDFCSANCMQRYNQINKHTKGPKITDECCVCHKRSTIEIEFEYKSKNNLFCSEPCFVAFKYVNDIKPERCDMCRQYFIPTSQNQPFLMRYDGVIRKFCLKTCQNIYITTKRKIVSCCWCKVKKYNFDMIQKYVPGSSVLIVCSLTCLNFFNASLNVTKSKKKRCDLCAKICKGQYHITIADDNMKNFCSYPCVQEYQSKYIIAPARFTEQPAAMSSTPTPTRVSTRKSTLQQRKQIIPDVPGPLPIITSVRSLAPTVSLSNTRQLRSKSIPASVTTITTLQPEPAAPPPVRRVVVLRPPDLPQQRNIATMVKPITCDVEVEFKPVMVDKAVQTEDIKDSLILVPIPVPIFVPSPMQTFELTHPVSIPFPFPVPIPMFVPVTKQSATVVLKDMKKAQIRTDPYEADLLMMAELVAGEAEKEKKENPPEIESEAESTGADNAPGETYSPEPQDASNTFGDDMLQMALKMATDFEEPAVDLEGALTANTITATAAVNEPEEVTPVQPPVERTTFRGRRRGRPPRHGGRGRGRGRPPTQPEPVVPQETEVQPPEPAEKPDANMCLKYTFGVNAWKQWVTTKNAELERSSRVSKPFKTDLLQLTSDELNYSLCLFVKEVRKPNGAEYAPDTIYYLCLGIQQYLFENGRIDNIFCDSYYESFTDCLDEVCRKFSTLYNDSQYIVTRVEEEHLWESKQLGAHSPHVLLTTLMFFNTKHFNLTNVEEHMQLSFSHIMKHWKRVPNQAGTPKNSSSRNILLRFYPPQSAVEGNNRKKKVYEQQENEENPLRCPVKLYEFYLSKCPESVKTRNDVFYLLPERSCVPDSPVWYSTMALGKEALEKMLHRVKMVKEINVALLAS